MHDMTAAKMTAGEINAFFDREFPQLNPNGRLYSVTEVGPSFATLRLEASSEHLRPGALTCTCRILKLGKRLAVLEASIFSGADGDLIAHATTTYSIPPR